MSGYARLERLIARVAAGGCLSGAVLEDLKAFRLSPEYRALPSSLREAVEGGSEAGFLLRRGADALALAAVVGPTEALAALRPALDLPHSSDPFVGTVYCLGEHLAEQAGNGEARAHFAACRERLDAVEALQGLGELLAAPGLSGALEGAAAWGAAQPGDANGGDGDPHPVPLFPPGPVGGYVPLSSAGHETPARAYLVQVRRLTDPRVAQFAIVPSTLVDLTDGDALGREDGRGGRYADLVLDFGDAPGLLREVEPDDLALRLVFERSGEFEPFSAADGTLFDVEAVPEEGRLYFKLRVPGAWAATGLPLEAIWPNVESVVLLSHSRDL